jgi:hypothetical protein
MNAIINHSRYVAWLPAVMLAALLAGCFGDSNPVAMNTDTTPPTVMASAPANLTASAPLNSKITATFSEAMNPATINATTFTVAGPGGSAVTGTVTYAGVTATFAQSANLAADTTYTITVTTGAKDANNNAMANNFVSTFTTGSTVDTNPPTVSLTAPLNAATNVAFNAGLSATFSEPMDSVTINAGTFTVTGPGGAPVAGTVSYVGVTAVFIPAALLAANTTYTATVTTGAMDLAGNALGAAYVWTFGTAASGTALDTTAPLVTLTSPSNNSANFPLNQAISVTFSKPMNPLTVNTNTFTLAAGTVAVAGTVNYVGQTATFTPSAPLLASTTYTATITTGAKDLAGNAFAGNFTWTFSTGGTLNATAPLVAFTNPAQAVQGVPINATVSATFSEAMDPSTISTATFTLMQGATPVAGAVAYLGLTATFTPLSNLAPATVYVATITTGAKDLSGNALAVAYTWTFGTGNAPDTTAPVVSITSPVNLAAGVCPSQLVSASFNKAMDPTTITAATFTLSAGTTAVPGVVSYDAPGSVATFTPAAALATSTTFTATVTTGVHDTSGNALAANKVWTFMTAAAACGGVQTGAVALGAASTFSNFGGNSGMTNQGIFTVINGDIGTTGASTTVTGFHDAGPGCIYTQTPLNAGMVNGNIYTAAPPPTVACPSEGTAATASIAAKAALAAQAAWNALSPASMPGGMDPGAGQLGGLTLAPGIYKSASGSFLLTGSDLTLDGKGDAGAVFVFQMGSSLTVGAPGAPRNIILINGAQAKNVFWQVGSSATINAAGGGTMVGTIIASAGVTFSTAGNVKVVTLNGRAVSLNASTTLVNTVINVPAP